MIDVTDTAGLNGVDQPSVDALLEQAIVSHQSWEFEQAEALYRAVLQAHPEHGDANHNLGVLLAVQLLQPVAALPYFEAALAANFGQGQYWTSYIDALIKADMFDAAQQMIELAAGQGLHPDFVQTLLRRLPVPEPELPVAPRADECPQPQPTLEEMNALLPLFKEHRYAEGEVAARMLTERYPGHGFGWKALGAMLQPQGKLADALSAKMRAAELLPDDVEAQSNLGNLLTQQGDLAGAESALRRAVQLKPEHAEAHNNLGNVLGVQGRVAEAQASLSRAIALNPSLAVAYNNISGTYHAQGRLDEAIAALRQALQIQPDYEDAYSNMLFALNYHPDKSPEEIFEAYRGYDQRFALPLREVGRGHGNSLESGRVLKVGYVSADFRQHACESFLEPLLAQHDKRVVEVFAYAELAAEDGVTARYKTYVDHWVATRGMSDQALAERIRTDGIDILVDLAGHTGGNRLGVFARKPAPVSLSWLGYGYTTGVSAIDYYLSDATGVPPGAEALFAETPWRLPAGYVYRPSAGMGEVGPLPALQRGHITLGTLTRSVRINHRTIRVWSEILRQLPKAQLVIDSKSFRDESIRQALLDKFAAHGIAAERLHIGCHSPPWDVLRGIDIALDCFPHNSGTTLFESLYMGLPFVSLAARPSVGRLGALILQGLGRPEWIADTEDEYVQKVLALATDIPRLAELRAGLRQQMQASALMDEPGFARSVEAAYQQMFAQWRATQKPSGALPFTSKSPADMSLEELQAEMAYNRGNAWHEQGQLVQAEASYLQALVFAPDFASAHNNLGLVFQQQGRFGEAEACYRAAVQAQPEMASAHHNLGNVLQHRGDLPGAANSYQRAQALEPQSEHMYSNLLFTLNYHPDKSGEEIFEAYREYDRRFGLPHRTAWQAHGNNRSTDRVLKVGYVSPDFRQHACLRFVEPLLAQRDAGRFEVYAYAELSREDDATARYKALVDHWVPTRGMSNEALAERIRADGIDILVDLAGHTAGNRLGVFARKPAPVSLSWLGYGYTTGVSAIDYYLSDEASAPTGSEHLFAETPWRLPHAYAYRPTEGMGEVGPLPVLRNGHITFGSLTRSVRLNHRTVRAWSALLQRVPGSHMVIDSKSFRDESIRQALLDKFAAHGIAAERLHIGCHSPPWDVLRSMDIALDCFPHNSGTTLFESLYMGLPFVSLAGRPSVGRLGASILHGLGRPEWIAHTEAEYLDKLVALAADLPRLAELRAGLRQQMQASALMDEPGFARTVEAAYQQMFATWALAQDPASAPTPAEMDTLVQLFRQARYAEGESLARALTQRFPLHGFGWKALGVMLQRQGRRVEVLAAKRKAAQLLPLDAEAHCNLGHVLQDQGLYQEAEAALHQALQLQPNYHEAHNNLGITYQKQARLDESLRSFQQALALAPEHEDMYSNMLFTLNYHPDKSGEEIFEAYREYDRRFGLPHRAAWQAHGNNRSTDRVLKVGYVSPDFRQHACLRFVEPLLAQRDAGRFEVYAYAELSREDDATARYKALVDHWVPTRGMSDEALAQRIRADGIDILVDLAGHSVDNRLGVFARKPAPVSLSWLGYGYTTGLTAIDYYLSDEASAPSGSEHLFAETPWRLPHAFVFRPATGMGEVGPLPALQNGHITFGSLTRCVRINHRILRAWSLLLQRIPSAHLAIDSSSFVDASAQADLLARFGAHGIAPERLHIGYHSPPWDMLRGVDIALDCFPHNSGTTLFESLYMGLPFISLVGRVSMGRLGATVLQGLGRPEWLAHTEAEYLDKLVALAADLPRLAELRAGLRQQMQASALMDEPGFARTVEAAYWQMFAAWSQAEPPIQAQDRMAHKRQAGLAYDQGNQLHALGQVAEAQACYEQALALDPGFADAHSNLGLVLQQQGRLPEAEDCYRQALVLQAGDAAAHYNLGTNLKAQGRLDEAESCFRAALGIDPVMLPALLHLDRVLQAAGRGLEMEAYWRNALRLRPDLVAAYLGLSGVLRGQRRIREAESCLRKALDYQPESVALHYQLGSILKEQARYEEAEKSCQRAVDIDPNSAIAWNNLAEIWNATTRYAEAETGFRKALQLAPQLGMAHGNLGIVLQNQGRLLEAEASLRHALALSPDHPQIHGNLLFVMNYHPDKTGPEVYADYQSYDQRFCVPLRAAWQPHRNRPEPQRILKIGYVSPDFRNHSCLYFLEPLLARHDKSAVRVYAYAELQREDSATTRYKSYVDHWVPTRGLSDDALARRIREDGIDILVDLAGHTAGNRLGVFARKPAPMSMSWLGYGYTTGLTAIDYYLTDAPSAPPGCEAVFSETPWRLPVAYCYRPSAAPMGAVNALPALQRGYMTFGTLTRAIRLNHRTIRVWSAILQRVPTAHLRVDSRSFNDAFTQEGLAAQFVQHGIARDRLHIGYTSPPWDVLRDMDIGLDCFPHNSGTTLFESLYMGVPYVTLAGRPSVGRLGSSILHGAGHPEWVASSEEEYVEIAVALAQNPAALARVRAQLRQDLEASALMDEAGFTRSVEAAYRQMFAKWTEAQQ